MLEQALKTCGECGVERPHTSFHKRSNGKPYSYCKPCAHAKTEAQHRRKKQKLWELKSNPCTDCGGTFSPCAMQFDHRDPKIKSFNVGEAIRGRSWQAVLDEIEKCDLVCANCHSIRTHGCGGDHDSEQFDPSNARTGRRGRASSASLQAARGAGGEVPERTS